MGAMYCGSFVLCLALAGASRADDQADAKAVVDKALKAMGGEAKVAKFKTGTWKGKATGQVGGNEIVITNEGTWQGLDKLRLEGEIAVGGRTDKVLIVINGDKVWDKNVSTGMVEDASAEEVPMIRSAFYAVRILQLLPDIKGKDFKLSNLGEVKINDKPAVGIAVAHTAYKDVSLFLDKETGLPVKSELRISDPSGKEITIEYVYADYKETAGVKHPMKITIKADGKEFVLELSEINPKDKVDESEFAKP